MSAYKCVGEVSIPRKTMPPYPEGYNGLMNRRRAVGGWV